MSQNILVVGGAGYIGTVVSDHFLKKGFNVICVDNFLYENSFSTYNLKKNKKFKFILGDLRNQNLINELLDNCDAVIILAGLVGDPITKKNILKSQQQ